MMDRRRPMVAWATALTVVGAVAAAAMAGPVWLEDEVGEAGETPSTGQVTQGQGVLSRIEGKTENTAGPLPPDLVDLYLIRICDPDAFFASTLMEDGGGAMFDPQLWLFSVDGPNFAFGLLGNDDFQGLPGSKLFPFSNDGTGIVIKEPGRYWLGISMQNRDPSGEGGAIFFQQDPDEISGPDGQGGNSPLQQWFGPVDQDGGLYAIELSGVSFGGGPDLDCNCNGIVDACDIANGVSNDENGDGIPDECGLCPGDFNGDEQVGFEDLLVVLSSFGPCPGGGAPCPADFDCNGIVGFGDLLALLASWGPCGGG